MITINELKIEEEVAGKIINLIKKYEPEIWEDFRHLLAKALAIPVVVGSADEAIKLFEFYAKESCETEGGIRHHVNNEYLEQYKTMEIWLKNRHKHYR